MIFGRKPATSLRAFDFGLPRAAQRAEKRGALRRKSGDLVIHGAGCRVVKIFKTFEGVETKMKKAKWAKVLSAVLVLAMVAAWLPMGTAFASRGWNYVSFSSPDGMIYPVVTPS